MGHAPTISSHYTLPRWRGGARRRSQITPSVLWKDTELVLPDVIATMRFRDAFGDRELGDMERPVPVARVLHNLPVALLMASTRD